MSHIVTTALLVGLLAVGVSLALRPLFGRAARLSVGLAALVAAAPLLTVGAPARAESPKQTIQRINNKITKLLRQKVKKGSAAEKKMKDDVKKAVNTLLDFEELARLALHKHWKERSDKERTEFVNILKDLIERNYVKQLRSNLNYKLEYRAEKSKGEKGLVDTAVKVEKNGRVTEILITYLMKKSKDGAWVVYDVVTDEVSIVNNYRSQFNRIIRKESYDALVKKMKRKLEETKS
jgi:phospholipid transport system substrate-binding protein